MMNKYATDPKVRALDFKGFMAAVCDVFEFNGDEWDVDLVFSMFDMRGAKHINKTDVRTVYEVGRAGCQDCL